MNSCIYACDLYHERFLPKGHRFDYSIFMFYFDLDELDDVAEKQKLISRNRFNIYSFRDSDHMRGSHANLKQNVVSYLEEQGIVGVEKIYLLTQLRVWGFIFNPVSFYIAKDADGQMLAVVAEVANTFNEMKLFPIDARGKGDAVSIRVPKHFYISPFSELDVDLVISLRMSQDEVVVSVDDYKGSECLFKSRLSGEKKMLSDLRLFGYTLRWPWITFQTVVAIHWQALRLWIKGMPVYRKQDNLHLQCGYGIYLDKNEHFKNQALNHIEERAI